MWDQRDWSNPEGGELEDFPREQMVQADIIFGVKVHCGPPKVAFQEGNGEIYFWVTEEPAGVNPVKNLGAVQTTIGFSASSGQCLHSSKANIIARSSLLPTL